MMDTGFVIVVSGLPRSGTSMMMRMLEAGGLPVLTDGIRKPNEDNPFGFYEFESAKRLKDEPSWLASETGKAVKVIYALLYYLYERQSYKVILMERNVEEVLAFQRRMLQRLGRDEGDLGRAPVQAVVAAFQSEIDNVQQWMRGQPNITSLTVNYRDVLASPRAVALAIRDFIGIDLDTGAMSTVVDASLYRQRIPLRS
jgi:hypothetical protein